MYNSINETIEVFVNFKNGNLQPICFSWRNKDYNIKAINFKHTSKQGNIKLWHFAVTSESDTYKLTYDPINTVWKLDEVFLESECFTKSLNDSYYKQY